LEDSWLQKLKTTADEISTTLGHRPGHHPG
jgi:hypothetical protein